MNHFFQVSGIGLIATGAYIKLQYGDFIQLSDSSLTTGPVFLIVIGVIVTIVGFLGCCGAVKENYCMVSTVSFSVLRQDLSVPINCQFVFPYQEITCAKNCVFPFVYTKKSTMLYFWMLSIHYVRVICKLLYIVSSWLKFMLFFST